MQKKKALEEVSTQIDKVKEDFKDVNDQRKEKFLDYFNKVNSSLKTMYEQLTKSRDLQGGEAHLSIMDQHDPFGTLYNQIVTEQNEGEQEYQLVSLYFKPPRKQFDIDINSRSGGEKTMAALAFIFALAQERYPKPPSMILLDEVDAHLDSDSVAKLTSFINAWKMKNKSQVMLITHKDEAVECCDSAIGVSIEKYNKPQDQDQVEPDDKVDLNKNVLMTAVTYSLNLKQYS